MIIEIQINIDGAAILTSTLSVVPEQKIPTSVLPLTIKGMLADLSRLNFQIEEINNTLQLRNMN